MSMSLPGADASGAPAPRRSASAARPPAPGRSGPAAASRPAATASCASPPPPSRAAAGRVLQVGGDDVQRRRGDRRCRGRSTGDPAPCCHVRRRGRAPGAPRCALPPGGAPGQQLLAPWRPGPGSTGCAAERTGSSLSRSTAWIAAGRGRSASESATRAWSRESSDVRGDRRMLSSSTVCASSVPRKPSAPMVAGRSSGAREPRRRDWPSSRTATALARSVASSRLKDLRAARILAQQRENPRTAEPEAYF